MKYTLFFIILTILFSCNSNTRTDYKILEKKENAVKFSTEEYLHYHEALKSIGKNALDANGLRIVQSQRHLGPGYVFTLVPLKGDSFLLTEDIYVDSKTAKEPKVTLETSTEKKIEIPDFSIKINSLLPSNFWMEKMEEEKSPNLIDDRFRWILEVNIDSKYKVLARLYSDTLFHNLFCPVKELMGITTKINIEKISIENFSK